MNNNYDNLLNFFSVLPPRKIKSSDFRNCFSFAKLFILLGSILTATMIGMAVLFGVLYHSGLLHTRGMGGKEVSPAFFLIFIPIVIPQLLLLLYGIIIYKKKCKILIYGKLNKATVISVKPLPARINDKTFYSVKVKLANMDGSIIGDCINNYSVDYFIEARDNHKPVDILTLPNMRKGILLYNMLSTKRFD